MRAVYLSKCLCDVVYVNKTTYEYCITSWEIHSLSITRFVLPVPHYFTRNSNFPN